ncbi:MAG: hypothetical protein U0T77_06675 [Chitinophagales bacterium]
MKVGNAVPTFVFCFRNNQSRKMKAAVYNWEYGAPEVLQVKEVAKTNSGG